MGSGSSTVIQRSELATAAWAVALFWLSVGTANAETACNMAHAFDQPDSDAPGGRTAVWASTDPSALFFISSLNVNTDGARRSYSVEDFWGRTTALNNLCNAMSDACAGLTQRQLKARRVLTQRAHQQGWPADDLARTKLTPNILPFKDGKPCPLVDGYFVSATSLKVPNIVDVCDLSNYVDSLRVPALVVPRGRNGFSERDVAVGDLAVSVAGDSGPVFSVVGDQGPRRKLGEGSLALNGKLLGRSSEPANAKEARTWGVRAATTLMFPGTHDANEPYLTPDRIEADARTRFTAWGGLERLQACERAYREAH